MKENHTLENLLHSATKEFNQRGYYGVSVSEIAGAVDLSKASIYHYVKSKNELAAKCVERAEQHLQKSKDLKEMFSVLTDHRFILHFLLMPLDARYIHTALKKFYKTYRIKVKEHESATALKRYGATDRLQSLYGAMMLEGVK